MKVNLKLAEKLVEKQVEKLIKKKIGGKADVQVSKLEWILPQNKLHVKGKLDIQLDRDEFTKLLEKFV